MKRRWLRLPAGAAIDARDADAWRFPPGTQLWKEFAVAGAPVETRYIERRHDGRWLFATYAWRSDGSDADLVPAQGDSAWPWPRRSGGRYALPSVADCHACHDSAAVPVLGFSAVQLTAACVGRRRRTRVGCRRSRRAAAERAADAVIRTDLRRLVATRRLRGLPVRLLATPPRSPPPTTPSAPRSATARQLRPLPQPQRQPGAAGADAGAARRRPRSEPRRGTGLDAERGQPLAHARQRGAT
ncbi:MAG: hypothetical protein U1F25_00700 [Rubrivivax sp.]